MDLKKITRLEVVDEDGRTYVAQGITEVQMVLQDEDRTLKIFITKTGKPTYNWVTGEVYAAGK